ncbi:hypothetical protein AB0N81_34810 [Streptomyces sp. NPDC093510]|uniref:hypothetical protein n=1 Tax=Streptomyces sp. NPDC093510 TaxID=3155199 RepID=UPI0034369914
MIGHLVQLTTGVDLARAAADTACGQAPDLTRTTHSAAAIRLLYPKTSGTLTHCHLDADFPPAHRGWTASPSNARLATRSPCRPPATCSAPAPDF